MLIRSELRKLLSGKAKWFLFFLFVINAAVYHLYLLPSVPSEAEQETYGEELYKAEAHGSLEKRAEQIETEITLLDAYIYGKPDEEGNIRGQHLEDEQALMRRDVLGRLQEEYQEALGFYDFINEIDLRAERLLTFSIFSKEGSFAQKNIVKTQKDFSDLHDIEIQPQDGSGLTAMQDFALTDFFMIAAVCIMAFQIFGKDARSGMQKLLNAAVNGGRYLRAVQVGTILMCMAVYAVLVYVSNLVQTGYLLGFPELSAELHGIAEYRNIPFPCTCGMYLVMYLLWKTVAVIGIAALVQAVIHWMNGHMAAWLIIGGALAVSFFLWLYLPENPTAKIFRYLNMIGIFDTGEILGDYQNLDLFTYPVQLSAAAGIFVAAAVVCGVLSVIFFSPVLLPRMKNERQKKLKQGRGIFSYEFYKTVWIRKAGAVFLVLCAISACRAISAGSGEEMISREDYYYEQMAADFIGKEGTDLAEPLADLEGKEQEFNDSAAAAAADRIRAQAGYVQADPEKNLVFVNERVWAQIFADKELELQNLFVYLAALMFSLAGIFQFENSSSMKLLIRSSGGSGKVYWGKLTVACILGGVYTAVIWIPVYVSWFWRYSGIKGLGAPAESLEIFHGLPLDITIAGMTVLLAAVRFLAGLALAVVLFSAAQIFLSSYQFAAVVSLVFLLPDVLLLISGMEMQYESPLIGILQGRIAPGIEYIYAFSSWASVWQKIPFAVYPAGILVLLLMMYAGYRKWINRG